MNNCGACGNEVTTGALRCRRCGAAFQGRNAETVIETRIEPLDGVGIAFRARELDADLVARLRDPDA